MTDIVITVAGRHRPVAVDSRESADAAAAAEVLQAAVDELTKENRSNGNIADELLLAAMKLADQVVGLADDLKGAHAEIEALRREDAHTPPAETPQNQAADPELLLSLERFARRTESLADRLEDMLTAVRADPREAL